ncbi:endonuclease [Bacteroidia bacterium]|nr:endonuclease [Bacteroidia bacterium]GHT57073.1 endonuclease [Bacteroidia bacterium]
MSKSSKPIKVNLILITIGVVIAVYLAAKQTDNPQNKTTPVIEKVEIPAEIAGRQEQIIEHIGYTVSYNSDWKIPNWVAYELTKEEVEGVTPRSNHFVPDPKVAYGMSATTDDYKNSGWDRGHMAPAADMKWSEQAMKESFYLSNICPQNHNLNAGIWEDLEEQVRGLATQKGKIYVVCGPIVSIRPGTIGSNEVAIPDAFFKVLLQNNNGDWSAIAFMFANESGRNPLSTYAMSVEDMQVITDIDFFPALPDSIEEKIESQVDFTKWNINNR